MTTTTMPYHWEMFQLIRFNVYTGHHFFSNDTKRFFNSRWQGTPPYKGRVFVTSERMNWNSPRLYSVRVIQPDGGIETLHGFGAFSTRYEAHAYAKAYAEENFVRVGNESVCLPKKTELV